MSQWLPSVESGGVFVLLYDHVTVLVVSTPRVVSVHHKLRRPRLLPAVHHAPVLSL